MAIIIGFFLFCAVATLAWALIKIGGIFLILGIAIIVAAVVCGIFKIKR